MPAYSPATATLPAGTRGRGVSSRGTASEDGNPVRYANPGAKPQNATRNSMPPRTSGTEEPQSDATKDTSGPPYRMGISTSRPSTAAAPAGGAHASRGRSPGDTVEQHGPSTRHDLDRGELAGLPSSPQLSEPGGRIIDLEQQGIRADAPHAHRETPHYLLVTYGSVAVG